MNTKSKTQNHKAKIDEEAAQTSSPEGDAQVPKDPDNTDAVAAKTATIDKAQLAAAKSDGNNARHRENNRSEQSVSGNVDKRNVPATRDLLVDRSQIAEVIRERQSSFIVFLDKSQEVRWLTSNSGSASLSNDASSAISRSRLVASTPVTYLSDDQKIAWKRMIGESVALALAGDVENSISTTKKSKQFILARAKETARIWFIEGSLLAFLPMLLFGISLYMLTDVSPDILWFQKNFWFHGPLSQAIVFGSIGAQFSMLLRISDLNVDPGAGRKAHYGEAFVRILLGVFGAIIAVVAVQADLIFGFINHTPGSPGEIQSNAEQWWIPAIALMAGASERFVPTFLNQMETNALTNGNNATEAGTSQHVRGEAKENNEGEETAAKQNKAVNDVAVEKIS